MLVAAGSQAADFGDVQIGGFVSQGYLQTNKNNYLADSKRGSFEFNEMGINFQTFPAENVMIGLQLTARDLGDVGEDEVGIGWAFGEYRWRDWLGTRAGVLKVPYGLYNETRDYDFLRPYILLPSGIYNEWLRDMTDNMKGMQLFGNVEMGKAGLLGYAFQGGSVQVGLDSGTALFIKELNPSVSSLDDVEPLHAYVANINWFAPVDGLRLGITSTYIPELVNHTTLANGASMTTTSTDLVTMLYSVEYIFRDLVLAGEYSTIQRDEERHIPALAMLTKSKFKGGPQYYVSASYRFTEWFQLGTYYSMYESDKDVDAKTNELEDICLSLRFDINESWIVKGEAHVMDGLFGVFPEDDGTLDDSWMLYAVKLSYSF